MGCINKTWNNEFTDRLIIEDRPILFVPKRIVSFSDKYTSSEYKQHFVLNYLQNENLKLQTTLVQKRANGNEYVTKKSIKEHELNIDKDYLIKFTEQHPEIFADFKAKTSQKLSSVQGGVFDDVNISSICNYLIERLDNISAGTQDASRYHNLIIGILELLLYPSLSAPKKEVPIHDGRKRIDITFNNSAETGFFYTLPNKNVTLPCQFIFVECKNYMGYVANPELDQLSGRFSNRRGKVGILACRKLDDDDKFLKRCSDTYHDERGLIIPITDNDIKQSLLEFCEYGSLALEKIIETRYREIVFKK